MKNWILDTGKTQLSLSLTDDGAFGSEFAKGPGYALNAPSEEFSFTWNGSLIKSTDAGWTLAKEEREAGSQGEELLRLTLAREGVTCVREYTVYKGTSAVSVTGKLINTAGEAAVLKNPSIFILRDDTDGGSLGYMTGGANFTGSLQYKELPLKEGFSVEFDSHGKPEMIECEGILKDDMHPVPNGTGIWCELYALAGERGRCWVSFDFQGWWLGRAVRVDGKTLLKAECVLNAWRLAPGEAAELPNAAMGFAAGDIDDMGNDIGEYIYTYKWDYTRDRYFMQPRSSIWREAPLAGKLLALVWEAQKMGSKRIHVDDFWFDAKGNWDNIFGDDFTEFNRYLASLGLDFQLWMPPWHADRLSRVGLEHRDWMLNFHGNWYNWTINMAKDEACEWILAMLNEKQKKWGTYMLRVDGNPTCLVNSGTFTANGGDYDPAFKQSANFYRLYRAFKDANPEAGLNGCSSGGHTMTIESVRYTDQQQITDGCCYHYGPYWAPLFNPVDKVTEVTIERNNNDPDLEPASEKKVLAMRELALFWNWGKSVGIAGRWVRVYRPEVEIGDKTYWLQRVSRDGSRSVLYALRGRNPMWNKPERVFPKGLDAERMYMVEVNDEGFTAEEKTGAEWMKQGIFLTGIRPDTVIYFNLTDRPGKGACTVAPEVPAHLCLSRETWLGREGCVIRWAAPENAGVIAFAEVKKNGEVIAEAASGNGWFDTSYVPGDRYEVTFVGLDGLRSPMSAEAR